MARPKKQTVDYYPHMAKAGKTIFIIESRWGNDGYAFFHKLLETLCSTDGHIIDYGNPAEREFLLAKTRVTDNIAVDILNKLAELGKIDRDLWEQDSRVWYQNLVDNVKDAYKKRIDELPRKPSFRHDKLPASEFQTPETMSELVSTDGSTESKVKYSRVKKSKVKDSNISSVGFDEFWSEYPKKVSKQDAVRAWNKIKPDEELFARIQLALRQQKRSHAWLKDNGQFVPNPATWINGRRWEDELGTHQHSNQYSGQVAAKSSSIAVPSRVRNAGDGRIGMS